MSNPEVPLLKQRRILAYLPCMEQLGQTRRTLETAMFVFAAVGIVSVMVESELLWIEVQNDEDHQLGVDGGKRVTGASESRALSTASTGFLALKCLLTVSTLALVVALVLRYRMVLLCRCHHGRSCAFSQDAAELVC